MSAERVFEKSKTEVNHVTVADHGLKRLEIITICLDLPCSNYNTKDLQNRQTEIITLT